MSKPTADPARSDRPSWRWLVTLPSGCVTDHGTTPPATETEMRAAYPDAVAFQPLFNLTPAMEPDA